jgi:hypothetical protein
VTSNEAAVLWLWMAHNKANRRLSGDLTDDPSYPKEIFPNRQHCTQCYDDQALGSDLWCVASFVWAVCLERLKISVQITKTIGFAAFAIEYFIKFLPERFQSGRGRFLA